MLQIFIFLLCTCLVGVECVADIHIPAVHVPGVYRLLWLLGVVGRSPVPGLLAVGALHPGHVDAQWPRGPERDCWLHRNGRSSLPIVRHRSQHRCAYLALCQVHCRW